MNWFSNTFSKKPVVAASKNSTRKNKTKPITMANAKAFKNAFAAITADQKQMPMSLPKSMPIPIKHVGKYSAYRHNGSPTLGNSNNNVNVTRRLTGKVSGLNKKNVQIKSFNANTKGANSNKPVILNMFQMNENLYGTAHAK
jgi:hypothetical protein